MTRSTLVVLAVPVVDTDQGCHIQFVKVHYQFR